MLDYVGVMTDVAPPALLDDDAEPVEANSGPERQPEAETLILGQLVTWLAGELRLLGWRSAQRALLAVVRHGGASAQIMLDLVLSDETIPPDRILDVLDVVIDDPNCTLPDEAPVVAWLSGHAAGPRLDHRVASAVLLERLGADVPDPPGRDAPAGLQLVVLRAPEPLSGAADVGANELDEMLGYDENEIARLARAAGIDAGTLAERIRARAITHAAELPSDRDAAEEASLLGWGYVRPSAMAVSAACHEAAAELVDAGLVSPAVALAALRTLTTSHADLLAARAVRRPACVVAAAPFAERSPMTRPAVWLEGLDDADQRLAVECDGWLVIGELSELTTLDRANRREEREQGLVPPDADALFTPVRRSLRDARDLGPLPHGASLIMRTALAGLSFGDGFIGLHPAAARAAGLEPDDRNPLSWRLAGELAVRALWWRSGFAQWRPYFDRDEVGDGWLVLATDAAVTALLAPFPNLEMGWAVSRKVREEDSGEELPPRAVTGIRQVDG